MIKPLRLPLCTRTCIYILLQNWVMEFDKWLPDKEKEERKRTSKPSRPRNKRSRQNGRLPPKSAEHLLPLLTTPLHGAGDSLPSLVNKDIVSMSTVTMETGDSQLFPGTLSDADQHLLSSLTSGNINQFSSSPGDKFVSTLSEGIPQGNNATTAPESRPLTPNPGSMESRSHTASPCMPDIQYRNFKLYVLSESVRMMEARLRIIKQWRAEGALCV